MVEKWIKVAGIPVPNPEYIEKEVPLEVKASTPETGGIRNESPQHEEVLTDMIEDLESEGYRVIRLHNKSPDAIAVRVNIFRDSAKHWQNVEICAVEVLGKTYRRGKGWRTNWTYTAKKQTYSMFDEVLIRTFKRDTQYQKGGPNPFDQTHS